jgi:hypothetical protein
MLRYALLWACLGILSLVSRELVCWVDPSDKKLHSPALMPAYETHCPLAFTMMRACRRARFPCVASQLTGAKFHVVRVSFLLLQHQGVLAQRSSPTDQCGAASAQACNECVCCCGEGLLTYKVGSSCLLKLLCRTCTLWRLKPHQPAISRLCF